MKKIALGILGVIVVAVVGVLGVASMRPEVCHIVRSTTVAAPPAQVYALVSDFRRFAEWSPWQKLDPNMKTTLAGTPATVGSSYSWDGNDKAGAGKMTIEALAPERVGVKLEFERPFKSYADVAWSTAADGANTKVTWTMDAHSGFIGKVAGMFMDMDKMVGGDLEKGLANLKPIVEKDAATGAAAAAAAATPAPTPDAKAAAPASKVQTKK